VKNNKENVVRIILPLVFAAVWISFSVKIEGVWPPSPATASLESLVQQIEQPGNQLLARVRAVNNPARMNTASGAADLAEKNAPRMILTALPKPPNHPAC